MDPVTTASPNLSQGADQTAADGAAQKAGAEFDAQFNKVMMSMAQGMMSMFMEDMQKMASEEDE